MTLIRTGLLLLCFSAGLVLAESDNPGMAYADFLFEKKDYVKSAEQYRVFVERYPSTKDAETAWFQLGESYRQSSRTEKARLAFETLIYKYKTGPTVGDAAFRLGFLDFKSNDFDGAVINFELASRESESSKTKFQAKYFNARSLQLIGKTNLALSLYDQLTRAEPDPETVQYQERSILEMANIYTDLDEAELAEKHFKKLIDTATTEDVKEEAIVRSGLAAVACGKIEHGEKILKGASRFRKDSKWKSLAEVGAIFIAYARKDYDRVISIYSSGSIISSAGEYRPKVLLMVADAFRVNKDYEGANRLYTLVAGRYPATPSGIEAGYRRLSILYRTNSGTLPAAVAKYSASLSARDPDNKYIDKAHLMLAEWHFFQAERGVAQKDSSYAKDQYRKAVDTYALIREENVAESLVPTLLYHQSWASLELDDISTGSLAVNTLLEKFPESDLVPGALAKRGETYINREDFQSALADFQLIISNYPESAALEIAMERQGRIYAHKRKLIETVSSYEALLEEFPETSGKAEANFWIGEGYFEQNCYGAALPYLEAARELDPDSYSNRAGLRIVLCLHSLGQFAEMADAARVYIQSGRDAGVLSASQKKDKPLDIPNHVLEDLAQKLREKGHYRDAVFFLNRIVDLDKPLEASSRAWREWATSKMHLKEYEAAIKGFDHLLTGTKNRSQRGFAYVNRGRAQLGLEQYAKARLSARECIRVVKQGRINADARMLSGEIAELNGDLQTAAHEYHLVSKIFDDPQITPLAMRKAIYCFRRLGDHKQAEVVEGEMKARIAREKEKRR